MTRTFRFPDDHQRADDIFTINDTAVAVDDMYTRWRLMPDPTGVADLLLHSPEHRISVDALIAAAAYDPPSIQDYPAAKILGLS